VTNYCDHSPHSHVWDVACQLIDLHRVPRRLQTCGREAAPDFVVFAFSSSSVRQFSSCNGCSHVLIFLSLPPQYLTISSAHVDIRLLFSGAAPPRVAFSTIFPFLTDDSGDFQQRRFAPTASATTTGNRSSYLLSPESACSCLERPRFPAFIMYSSVDVLSSCARFKRQPFLTPPVFDTLSMLTACRSLRELRI